MRAKDGLTYGRIRERKRVSQQGRLRKRKKKLNLSKLRWQKQKVLMERQGKKKQLPVYGSYSCILGIIEKR